MEGLARTAEAQSLLGTAGAGSAFNCPMSTRLKLSTRTRPLVYMTQPNSADHQELRAHTTPERHAVDNPGRATKMYTHH